MPKLLALDVGEKRIGLATTDELKITCSPFGWIEREGSFEKIKDLLRDENIEKIIIGLPYLPSGDLGSQGEDVKRFIDELNEIVDVEIDFENEVLTSVEAEKRLREISKKIPEKGDIDAMAACIILESYIKRSN